MGQKNATDKNWLERHPKTIITGLLVVVVVGMAYLSEKILARQAGIHNYGVKRYVRLRENRPLFDGLSKPAIQYVKDSVHGGEIKLPFRMDRDGFILPSKIHEHPDLTVVFLGGSTTECGPVEEEKRFPFLVGRMLEKETGLKTNSYNSGVAGNDTLHAIQLLLSKVIPLQPDLVVMMENINDLSMLMYQKTYWSKVSTRSQIIEVKRATIFMEIIDRTIPNLYEAAKYLEWNVRKVRNYLLRTPTKGRSEGDEFQQVRGKRITLDKAFLVREYTRNLQTFINICRARNITPVLMTQANRLKVNPDPSIQKKLSTLAVEHGINYKDYKDVYDSFNQAARDTAAQNGVLVIDLAKRVPQEMAYICDVVHFNGEGSSLAAKIISEDLKPVVQRRTP